MANEYWHLNSSTDSNLWRYYRKTIVVWPHDLTATCWWRHPTECTVVVIKKRAIYLHILIDSGIIILRSPDNCICVVQV